MDMQSILPYSLKIYPTTFTVPLPQEFIVEQQLGYWKCRPCKHHSICNNTPSVFVFNTQDSFAKSVISLFSNRNLSYKCTQKVFFSSTSYLNIKWLLRLSNIHIIHCPYIQLLERNRQLPEGNSSPSGCVSEIVEMNCLWQYLFLSID